MKIIQTEISGHSGVQNSGGPCRKRSYRENGLPTKDVCVRSDKGIPRLEREVFEKLSWKHEEFLLK